LLGSVRIAPFDGGQNAGDFVHGRLELKYGRRHEYTGRFTGLLAPSRAVADHAASYCGRADPCVALEHGLA
jgi:hypothetical protein